MGQETEKKEGKHSPVSHSYTASLDLAQETQRPLRSPFSGILELVQLPEKWQVCAGKRRGSKYNTPYPAGCLAHPQTPPCSPEQHSVDDSYR